MPDIVTSIDHIVDNLKTFQGYQTGDFTERKIHKRIIKNVKKFVVMQLDDHFLFAPGRFVAYQSNDLEKYDVNKDSPTWERALARFLGGKLSADDKIFHSIDSQYLSYCADVGTRPSAHFASRQFWFLRGQTDQKAPELSDAIDDLGSDVARRSSYSSIRYSRDPKIREAVRKRAKGKCEFCGEAGFSCTDGEPYLECHHIIALAKDGEDRMTNVIALCPRDHREAHFGLRGAEIEKEMIQKLKSILGGR